MSVLQTPQPDFVVDATFLCSGVEGAYSGETGGTQRFPDVQGDNFVPYATLTESEVLDWIWDQMGPNGKSNAEACVEGQIESEKNPPVSPTSEPLPW
tara:strand:+ start:1187 stop:1477 length:291 start_codon:yes stop_codon:yes gene_type:complete